MRTVPVLAALVVLAGCGGGTAARQTTTAPHRPSARSQIESVVRAWSARLNAGDNAGIARLFRLPAIVIQGPYGYRLTTARQVEIWHSALPCSGKIVSIDVKGRYATAVFRLGNRKTSKCDAPGSLAAARFGVVRGKIVSWQQVAVPKSASPA